MKKVITFIIMLVMLFSAFSVTVFAEGDVAVTDSMKTMLEGILDRLFEWWNENKAEILAACSGLGAAFASIVLWLKNKKPFLSLLSAAKTTHEREGELIKGYNEVVEVIGQYNENVKELTKEVCELKRLVLDTEDIEGHIAKVLSTVYTNSIALPQGVKDMINVECAQAMTVANRDLGVEVISYDTTDDGDFD